MSSIDIKKGWIIDIEATNHMVADLDLLTSYIKLDSTKSKRVFFPTGDIANVTHVGTSMIIAGYNIDNVLYLPKFKFNLLSVSPDLYNGKVKVIGRQEDGLYLLPSISTKSVKAADSCSLSQYDHSLFTKKAGNDLIIILVYVDDMLITGSSLKLLKETKATLHQAFRMKDLGELRYFLGIKFARSKEGILMHQSKCTLELISELGLGVAKQAGTPLEQMSS
ncbi:uncharacterized protein LOC124893298 [Capsicum annuum]|uniref:uncharacterized protein LOC124893298 n=1 Tax=Capsicum annuum TaxID=4072 RepID=UPI001FB193FD|nr:uncharacterized protein LOC124893298 [Capsicum annuum]